MVDSPRCVYGDECPQRRLSERRTVESLDKYRKETIEKFDLCDGTLLSKMTIVEGDAINGEAWGTRRTEEKWRTEGDRPPSKNRCSLPVARRESTISNCSRAPVEEDLLQTRPPKDYSFPRYIEEPLEVLRREQELPHAPFHVSTPEFPLCDYHPPRPVSEATHHETVSLYDSFNSKKTADRPSESPAPVPERYSLRVDERSLNDTWGGSPGLPKPMERLSIYETGILSRGASPRLSVTSAPPETTFHQDRKKSSIHFLSEEWNESNYGRRPSRRSPTPPPIISPDPKKHPGRQSVRSSSRSLESRYQRSKTVEAIVRRRTSRNPSPPRRYSPERPHSRYSPEPLRRYTPEPIGDYPRPRELNYEVPVYRENGFDRYALYGRCPERARLQEETVTKETFERVTTTRKLFQSTLV